MSDEAPKYLTPDDVVARWSGRVSVRTLANWRSAGRSPPYTKLGGKIAYPLDRLVQWEARANVTSTSQYGANR